MKGNTSNFLRLCQALFLLLLSIVPAPTGTAETADPAPRLTYLANEGFLIESGETAILIDALFGKGLPHYPAVPAAERRKLEAAEPPYDRVALVLATHHHGDHFDAAAVARFLRASPKARLVSTPQAVARLEEAVGGDRGILARVQAVLPAEGDTETLAFPGIGLTVLNLHHGRGRDVQNLGFLLDLGGTTLLHVGDTEVTVPDLASHGYFKNGVDIALLPAWFLTYDDRIRTVREQIRPRRIVAMHLAKKTAPASYFGPDSTYEKRLQQARRSFPEAVVMTEPLTPVELRP